MKMDDIDDHNHTQMLLTSLLALCSLLLITLPHSHSHHFNYSNCERPFNCGEVSEIFYPFWGKIRAPECGGGEPFQLSCHHDNTTILIGSQNFTVKMIDLLQKTMRLVRTDLLRDVCNPQREDTFVNPTLFQYPPYNVTVYYDCPHHQSFPFKFSCGNVFSYFAMEYDWQSNDLRWLRQNCKPPLRVPVNVPMEYFDERGDQNLTHLLDKRFEFDVKYDVSERCINCLGKDVYCSGFDRHTINSCYHCPDGSNALHCSSKRKWEKKKKLIILGVAGSTIAGVLIIISILCLKYKSPTWLAKFGLAPKSNQNIEAFLKIHGSLALKRYTLSQVKQMTMNFKEELGQGGFGTVYKGKLSNGSSIAVKMLSASKKNGEEFINEVASICRTSHVNVVSLLGFCLKGRKRALIYEFMPNGSLDKFIYRKSCEVVSPLSWDIIYQIAGDIARGLEYLHKGCNTRIVHFDIKPHNILLDENFHAKISDFGLAKLCPRNESIVSLSDARGTMGYVAPEMWSRNLGRASHKSDVYSYGMMLLEMVGGRKNINAEASHTSEIYFPHWAYNKLESDNDLTPDMMMTTEENEIAKRLAIVGLWCTQTFPNDRPTMSSVIDMLGGNMDSLQIPPKPLLSSPTRSVPEYSIS